MDRGKIPRRRWLRARETKEERGRLRLGGGANRGRWLDGGLDWGLGLVERTGWLLVIPMGIERVAARWDKKPRF